MTSKVFSALENVRIRNTLIILYILAVLGFSASARAEFSLSNLQANPAAAQKTKQLVGKIAVTLENEVFLFISDEVAFQLKAEGDLTAFNGMDVLVVGHELMQKVGPVYQLASFNPLENDEQVLQAPLFYVLDIRELAE